MHHTDHDGVEVLVADNLIFSNGKVHRKIEGRQNAGGLVINTGKNVQLLRNRVHTATADMTYQCYGTCGVDTAKSSGNVHCGGTVSTDAYPTSIFVQAPDCAALSKAAIRARYPVSTAPTAVPQYAFFKGHVDPLVVRPKTTNLSRAIEDENVNSGIVIGDQHAGSAAVRCGGGGGGGDATSNVLTSVAATAMMAAAAALAHH